MWFGTLTFNTISRIYAFSEEELRNVIKEIREGFLASYFIVNLTLLAAVCHLTANEVSMESCLILLIFINK